MHRPHAYANVNVYRIAQDATQTVVERAALLQQRRLGLSTESSEERAARLQQLSDKLASEPRTPEQRAARLQQPARQLDCALRHRRRELPGYIE